jgi:hypothetical protein
LLRPVLLYGCETGVLKIGPKILNGVYRRRFNHELDKKFNSPNALNVTKTSRLGYAGYIIRNPEDLLQRALFRAKPIGRRNQGRPKSRLYVVYSIISSLGLIPLYTQ